MARGLARFERPASCTRAGAASNMRVLGTASGPPRTLLRFHARNSTAGGEWSSWGGATIEQVRQQVNSVRQVRLAVGVAVSRDRTTSSNTATKQLIQNPHGICDIH